MRIIIMTYEQYIITLVNYGKQERVACGKCMLFKARPLIMRDKKMTSSFNKYTFVCHYKKMLHSSIVSCSVSGFGVRRLSRFTINLAMLTSWFVTIGPSSALQTETLALLLYEELDTSLNRNVSKNTVTV